MEVILYIDRSMGSLSKLSGRWLQLGLICIVTLVVYWPTFDNGFQMEWDDQWMLINHELVLNPTWENLQYYFTHYVDGQYFPLNQLYYLLLFQINGLNPFVFHLGSLIIHMLNTAMVFLLLSEIVQRIVPTEKYVTCIVLLATLLFAIHPLQVEPVAWISASKVLLFAFCTLSALLLYFRYLDNLKYPYLIAVFLCYILGFMSKEQMIVLPILLILFDFFFRRQNTSVRRLMIEKIPFLVVALILWYYAAKSGMGALDTTTYPWYQRMALGSYCYFTYWFRFLAPVGLLHFYDFPIEVGESLPSWYYFYLIMVILLGYGIVEWWKSRLYLVVFCLLFTVINLALVLHIVPSPRTYMAADRFVYLPMVGMGLLFAWAIIKSWTYVPKMNGGIVLAMVTGLLVVLGVISYGKTEQWHDSLTLKKEIREYLDQKKAMKR